jgi:hypothetical protein
MRVAEAVSVSRDRLPTALVPAQLSTAIERGEAGRPVWHGHVVACAMLLVPRRELVLHRA